MSECESLPIRLYESNWVQMIREKRDDDYRQILYIFMERLKQNGQILVRVTVYAPHICDGYVRVF